MLLRVCPWTSIRRISKQMKMTTNGPTSSDSPNVTRGLTCLTHDVIELTELQMQLLALDVKDSWEASRTAIVLAIVGVSVLTGAIPVALAAFAELLIAYFRLPLAAGYSVAAIFGMVCASACIAIAWIRVRRGLVGLRQSREELRRNIAAVKACVRNYTAENLPAND